MVLATASAMGFADPGTKVLSYFCAGRAVLTVVPASSELNRLLSDRDFREATGMAERIHYLDGTYLSNRSEISGANIGGDVHVQGPK
jgi:hypothetical protein